MSWNDTGLGGGGFAKSAELRGVGRPSVPTVRFGATECLEMGPVIEPDANGLSGV
jgi:hypothetical protein